MPTYDYKCKECNVISTVSHSIHGENPQVCNVCGKPMTKLFGAVPASFKGEGFYTTDKFTDR